MINSTFFLNIEALRLKDDDIHNYPLMESPWPLITIVGAYIIFIFQLGPRLMKNTNPFSLKTTMMIYNLAQIILNGILFIKVAKLAPNFNLYCSPVNSSNSQEDISIRQIHYYYLLLKFLDLADTVFFVLRKKQNQISLLHTHHHIVMVISMWLTLKYIPGGIAFSAFFWNTFVHFVMYTYYLLTSTGKFKSIWWKKYLTQLQLLQHYSIAVLGIIQLLNVNCSYPKTFILYCMCNGYLSIYLFTKFYIKNYVECEKKSL